LIKKPSKSRASCFLETHREPRKLPVCKRCASGVAHQASRQESISDRTTFLGRPEPLARHLEAKAAVEVVPTLMTRIAGRSFPAASLLVGALSSSAGKDLGPRAS